MSLRKNKIIIPAIILVFAVNNFACKASTLSYNRNYSPSAQEKSLKTAINKNPGNTEVSLRLIKLYLDNDQNTRAMTEINRIKSKTKNNPKFYILAANALLKRGLFKEAEVQAKKAINISYNNTDAFMTLANIYFEKAVSADNTPEGLELKKVCLKKAFDNCFTAYKYNPACPFAHIGLANAYYMNGQNSFAQDEILKAKDLSVNNAEALYLIGEYYYKTKEYSKSETYLKKSVSAGLTSKYTTYYLLGKIYENDGKTEIAQKNYLKALKLKPDHVESQQNLDNLIKVTYKESEILSEKQKLAVNSADNLDDELNTVMQADYFLVTDEFTRARELYIKVLDKKPGNINAIKGLAELYYAKWVEGFGTSADFINDSKYILKTKESSGTAIPFTKFKLINEDKLPEVLRQKFINLSVSETYDFYDLLNEVRAEFLLGNFEESHEKLEKLLSFKLSNYEKFKVLKSLCCDHDYDEALILIEDLKKNNYHNEELTPILNRINTKFNVVNEKLNQAITLYNNKKADFVNAESIIEQEIKYFPTSQKAYLAYVYMYEKQKNYKEALAKADTCYRLIKLYPDKTAEITEPVIKKLITDLNRKLAESEAKNKNKSK